MTNVTLFCKQCNYRTRRSLVTFLAGCRGVHETPAEDAWCPAGHGKLSRLDGRDWSAR